MKETRQQEMEQTGVQGFERKAIAWHEIGDI
jgi:hypothetical protein